MAITGHIPVQRPPTEVVPWERRAPVRLVDFEPGWCPALPGGAPTTTRNLSRHGGILPVTFMIVAMVGTLMLLSSDLVLSTSRLQKLGNARQQAVYAAEAVAAMREVMMVNLAANNDLTGLDTGPNPNSGTEWFGNCLVRWRIEPVKVTNPNGSFTVNPVADVNVLPPSGNYLQNYEFYTFRIATEAFALSDPNNTAATPWSNPNDRICAVQATRVVQLKLNSLFKYAIFYAAEGNTGDLEFWVGTSISVAGAVHTNGALYIGGQGVGYLSGNYHDSCSLGGGVSIGGSGTNQVTVTGIDGIFRMRKGINTLAFRNPTHPYYNAALQPGDIPSPFLVRPDVNALDDNGVMTGVKNLNGDSPSSSLHKINGKNFTSKEDSRSAGWLGSSVYGQYVRDAQVGATVVKTLSNIPELAGRPFEAQRIVATGQPLFWKDPGDIDADHSNNTQFTINPTADSRALYYTDFAAGNYTPTDVATDPVTLLPRTPVMADHLPLFDLNGQRDVWPDLTAPPVDAATSLPVNESRGYYLTQALTGSGTQTGLAFRERGAQNTTFFSGAKPTLSATVTATEAQNYAKYMKSQYQVLMGGKDITDPFFNQIQTQTGANAGNNFICREDSFVNLREATAMNVFYSNVKRGDYFNNGTNKPYVVNVLHLNIGKINELLLNTNWSALDTTYIGTDKARQRFNGLIYAHRTRRSLTYHPLLRPTLVFNKYAVNTNYTLPSTTVAPIWPYQVREGNGPIETFHCGIRIGNAADINWNHVAATNPLGTSGLTIITPNMCYLQGNFNTVTHPDASGVQRTTPCAVFSDGLTALSNAWSDTAAQHLAAGPLNTGLTAASTTTYNLSLVINNVPTDDLNATDEGSGAVANVVRFLENWGGQTYNFKGSLVVMNRMRYSYTSLGANACALNMNTGYYSPPSRALTFNTDLLTKAGQPPYTPFGVQVIRTVSTLVNTD